MFSCHTADSKPVKQEVNGTVILPPDSTKAVLEYLVWLTRATTMAIGAQVVWVLKRGKIGKKREKIGRPKDQFWIEGSLGIISITLLSHFPAKNRFHTFKK